MKVSQALFSVSGLVNRTNKLIDETSPWALAKDEKTQAVLESVLYHLLEAIRLATILYIPVLIEYCPQIFDVLGVEAEKRTLESYVFGAKDQYSVAKEGIHILPRLDFDKEVEYIKSLMNNVAKPKKEILVKPEIGIEEFDKIDLKVGKVLEAIKHPNAAKLLVLKVDTGDRIRQVVSGIAEFYKPEDLIGKQLIIVANLKPVKLRGELSEGMILCGDNEGKIVTIEASSSLPPGSPVK
jgi:methionyl-tRNA synthetase